VIAQLLTENEKEGEAARRLAGAAAVARHGAVYVVNGSTYVEDRSTPNKNSSCYSRTARLERCRDNLYGPPTYVDKSFAREEYVVFEAGTYTNTIKLRYYDYEKIVPPRVD
jgi:hypothetical protein